MGKVGRASAGKQSHFLQRVREEWKGKNTGVLEGVFEGELTGVCEGVYEGCDSSLAGRKPAYRHMDR
eukprot:807279-Pleurochrysis_carterae.AAC.1